MINRQTHYRGSAVDFAAMSVARNATCWLKLLKKHGFIPLPPEPPFHRVPLLWPQRAGTSSAMEASFTVRLFGKPNTRGTDSAGRRPALRGQELGADRCDEPVDLLDHVARVSELKGASLVVHQLQRCGRGFSGGRSRGRLPELLADLFRRCVEAVAAASSLGLSGSRSRLAYGPSIAGSLASVSQPTIRAF